MTPTLLLPTAAPQRGRLLTASGHLLAYEIFGDRSLRKPVFYLHGVPGRGREASLAHVPAEERGISLIAVDRPGFGESTFRGTRTILDTPGDIAALADHLNIGRFGVLGVSGGGPHAAACAMMLHGRVTGVSLVSSLAPFEGFAHPLLSLRPYLRFAAACSRNIGGMVTRMLLRLARRSGNRMLRHIDAGRPAADLTLLERPEIAEVFRKNLELIDEHQEGLVHELLLLSNPWGFKLENIRTRVHVWHGKADPTVPLSMGKHLAKHIPGAKRHFVPHVGHLLILHRLPQILEVMRRGFSARPPGPWAAAA